MWVSSDAFLRIGNITSKRGCRIHCAIRTARPLTLEKSENLAVKYENVVNVELCALWWEAEAMLL